METFKGNFRVSWFPSFFFLYLLLFFECMGQIRHFITKLSMQLKGQTGSAIILLNKLFLNDMCNPSEVWKWSLLLAYPFLFSHRHMNIENGIIRLVMSAKCQTLISILGREWEAAFSQWVGGLYPVPSILVPIAPLCHDNGTLCWQSWHER